MKRLEQVTESRITLATGTVNDEPFVVSVNVNGIALYIEFVNRAYELEITDYIETILTMEGYERKKD